MAKVYQYDANGYYAGEGDSYGGPLPNNSTYMAPLLKSGFIPHWNGETWDQVENHKGKQGWLDGQPYIIKDYGASLTGAANAALYIEGDT